MQLYSSDSPLWDVWPQLPWWRKFDKAHGKSCKECEGEKRFWVQLWLPPLSEVRLKKIFPKFTTFYSREFNRKRHMELHVLFKHSQGRERSVMLPYIWPIVLFRSSIWLWTVWKEVQDSALCEHSPEISWNWRLQLVLWRVRQNLQPDIRLPCPSQGPLKC